MRTQTNSEVKRLDDQLQQIPNKPSQPPLILRYGVAFLAVTAALIINRLLNVNMVGAPAMLFLCALMFSAWYGGVKPALFALPLAVLAFAHYFVTPVNSWTVDVREIPRLLLFVLSSLFVISLSASQKRAAESLRQARDVLAGTVEELKRTNQALRTEIRERERVEEELRERAADLTEAQRVGKIGNWILNLRTNRISWSEQVYRIFEVKEKDFAGRYESFVARIHPDDRPLVRKTNAQARTEGSPFDIEYRVVTPNEEIRIIREVGYAARDEAGDVCRLFGTVQDITDRKLIEWALDERLRFESMVTELSATFANLSPNEVDREIDKWLQRLVEFLGVDRASFLQFADDWTMPYRSNSYTVPGIEPLPASPIDLKNQFPWITEQLRRGITVKWSRVPDDMPEEATKEKENATRFGVKSALNIPVRVGGSVICAISFTSILTYRDWPEAVIPRLQLVGEIFAAAVERKRADAALRQSEQQFRQMAENIREVFWLTTADMNKLLYISPAYEAVWGQSCENLYKEPRSFFDTIHPEDRSRVASIHERDREKGFEVEYRVIRPDGSIRWIRDRGFPIHDDSGRLYRLAGIAEDITDQKHAAALLHAKEQEFRAIVENAPDQIIRYDREFRRMYVNPAVAQFYGVPAENLVGRPLGIMKGRLDVKENEVAHVRERVAAVFSTGKSHDYELTWTMPNGARHFSVRLFPEFDLNGAVVNVLGISRDVTERKRAEEALRSSEERLRLVIDTIPIMAWTLGPDGSVDFVNQRWLDYTGLTWEQYTDDQNGLIHPEDRARAIKMWLANMATGNRYEAEMRLRRADGEYRWFLVRCAPLRDEQGQLIKWYGVSTDIEERKRAEERIRSTTEQLRALPAKLQSAKEEEDIRIAREIHDEMGSTLTSLRWELERLDRLISDSEDWSHRQELRAKITEMMRLTDVTIGTMRRIASELRPSVLDDLGLPEAIEWQAQQFQTRTGIVCSCDCSLEDINFDPDQSTAIFRIFQEALTNVLSHAGATRVDVITRKDDGEFVLTISDNGRGITEDEKLASLSLGIVGMRERAHLIGGQLEISGTQGKGTVVAVRVPIAREVTGRAQHLST